MNGQRVKKALEITLGIVTSIGGFIDAGSFATSLQAGARFGYRLIWATVLGTICAVFLTEMSGRLAICSKHPLRELIHKRFGLSYSAPLLAAGLVLNFLVVASEIGGVSMALDLATGVSYRVWAIPAALLIWALLWFLTFGVIEKATAVAGLLTLAFVVAAVKLGAAPPSLSAAAPSISHGHAAEYGYIAVSIIGSIITPFMFFFYSSGCLEEKWDQSYRGVNRAVATLGMGFGALIALAVMAVAAAVLAPMGIRVETYAEAAGVLTPVFPNWGRALFIGSLWIASFGAGFEVSLSAAYELAQTFGWNWGKEQKARDESRFTLSYTILLIVAALPIVAGIDPLKLTVFTMAVACLMLPFVTFPFLILMNDRQYLGEQVNSRWTNFVVTGIVGVAFVLAIVAVPLQILGGS